MDTTKPMMCPFCGEKERISFVCNIDTPDEGMECYHECQNCCSRSKNVYGRHMEDMEPESLANWNRRNEYTFRPIETAPKDGTFFEAITYIDEVQAEHIIDDIFMYCNRGGSQVSEPEMWRPSAKNDEIDAEIRNAISARRKDGVL